MIGLWFATLAGTTYGSRAGAMEGLEVVAPSTEMAGVMTLSP